MLLLLNLHFLVVFIFIVKLVVNFWFNFLTIAILVFNVENMVKQLLPILKAIIILKIYAHNSIIWYKATSVSFLSDYRVKGISFSKTEVAKLIIIIFNLILCKLLINRDILNFATAFFNDLT